jgi:tetratricopeptide (TPR) repeat protein
MAAPSNRFIYLLGLFLCTILVLGLLSGPHPNQVVEGILILAGAACFAGAIYRRKPKTVMPGRGPTHQLDYPPSPFLGRKAELSLAAATIKEGRLVAIIGKHGAGKTALALKLAYDWLAHYPDAQFHLDLGGKGSEPLSVEEAQAGLLHNIDPAARLPEDAQQLAALYQSAFQGKHVVLLLDNAASAEQVQALLPPPGSLVIVTAQDVLDLPDLLDLRPISLEGLSTWDSRRLFRQWTHPFRFSWFDRPTANLIQACHGLPGALHLVARLFRRGTASQAGELLQRFGDFYHGFSEVESALRLSYSRMTPEEQKYWRLLAVFSGSFDLAAAAAIWDVPADKARPGLLALQDLAMLASGPTSQRYGLSGEARAYASSLLSDQERSDAYFRHAGFYRALLDRIDSLYTQGEKKNAGALPWLDLEWANVRAAQEWITANRHTGQAAAHLCSLFPNAGVNILNQRLSMRQLAAWLEAGLQAAAELGYRQLESHYLGGLGNLYSNLGEMRKSVDYYQRRLEIDRAVGDRRSEANTLSNLGVALTNLGDLGHAAENFQLAAPLFHEFADRYREGLAYAYLGDTFRLSGQPPQAISYYQQALQIFHEFKDRHNEAIYTGSLGLAYANQGELSLAIQHYQEALPVFRTLDDRHGEGITLKYLGDACSGQGQGPQAVDFYQQALSTFRRAGDPRGEADVLGALGVTHLNQETPAAAAVFFEQALVIDRKFGNRRSEVKNLTNLGITYQRLGDLARSAELYQQALLYYQELNDQQGEANLYWSLGLVYAGQGDLPRAIANMQMLVDYENATGQSNAEQHAAQVEELRRRYPTGPASL